MVTQLLSKNGACQSEQSTFFFVVMVSSKYQFTYFAGTHLGGSVMSRLTTFCQIPWD